MGAATLSQGTRRPKNGEHHHAHHNAKGDARHIGPALEAAARKREAERLAAHRFKSLQAMSEPDGKRFATLGKSVSHVVLTV